MLIEHSTDALKTYYEMGYKAGFKKGVASHPVNEQLTDKDIAEAMVKADPLILGGVPTKVIKDFVVEILRKAQE